MGRPPSMTGQIMGDHLTICKLALVDAQKAAEKPLINRVTDPVEWAGCVGEVIQFIREAIHELDEIDGIYEANKRRGVKELIDDSKSYAGH